jgi:PiT family inorganic phosphate transporter
MATAITVLISSSLGLPVSTSHALIGGVVGIGLSKNFQQVRWQTLKSVVLAWVVTVPVAALLGAITFMILRSL